MNKLDSIVPRTRLVKFLFGIYNQYFSYLLSVVPFIRPARKKFVIFGQGRTGSTLLVKILNTHPEILCEREIFQLKNNIGSGQIINPHRMLKGKAKLFGSKVYGFKVKIYQLKDQKQVGDDVRGFIKEISKRGWKLIYLKRLNLFEHVLSSVVAESLSTYHFNANSDKRQYEKLQVRLEREDLLKRLNERRGYLVEEAQLLKGLDFIEVTYEDLSVHPQQVANKIFDFLHLDPIDISIPLSKSNTKRYSDLIENFEEVEKYLEGTEYAHYLVHNDK